VNSVIRFLSDEHGHDLITQLMAFVALASAVIFVRAGTSENSIWKTASNQLSNAAAPSVSISGFNRK
jgi:hypothetical protein